MWQQYKKTLVRTQAFILLLCAAAVWVVRVHPAAVLAAFLAMQTVALVNAAWSAKLSRLRLEQEARDREMLPPERRP